MDITCDEFVCMSLQELHIKGLVNLQKYFFQTPIDLKGGNERNRIAKALSKNLK